MSLHRRSESVAQFDAACRRVRNVNKTKTGTTRTVIPAGPCNNPHPILGELPGIGSPLSLPQTLPGTIIPGRP